MSSEDATLKVACKNTPVKTLGATSTLEVKCSPMTSPKMSDRHLDHCKSHKALVEEDDDDPSFVDILNQQMQSPRL
eukprot:1865967-Amphidinium_carterae.1